MRKLAVVISLVLALSLAACQAPTPAPATTQAPAAPAAAPEESAALAFEGVTLTYIIDRDTDQTATKAVMEAFSAQTGVTFEEELRPGGADGETILKTRFATGDAPDFIWFNAGSLLNTLDPEKNLIDISGQPYMSKLPDSYKQTVNGGTEGKVYGIPGRTSMGGGWFYNKKVAAELGLSVPTTWAELIENCKTAKAAGTTAIIGSYADSWTAQLILLADYGNVAALEPNFAADFDANKAKFATSPASLRSFEKLAEVKEYLNEDYLATTNDLAYEMPANLPQICVECGSGVKAPADCAADYDKDVEKQAQQLGLAGW